VNYPRVSRTHGPPRTLDSDTQLSARLASIYASFVEADDSRLPKAQSSTSPSWLDV